MSRCPYWERACNGCESYKGKGYRPSCKEGYFKSWDKAKYKKKTACYSSTACADCEHHYGTGKCKLNMYKPKPKSESKHSLCWDCIRSAAPKGLQCVWDATKGQVLPEGARCTREEADKRAPYIKTLVLSCPEFLSVHDKANQKLLAEARKKA